MPNAHGKSYDLLQCEVRRTPFLPKVFKGNGRELR